MHGSTQASSLIPGQSLGDRLLERGVSRRDFLAFCRATAILLGLDSAAGPRIARALQQVRRPTVIWLELQECTGCVESVIRTAEPTIGDLVLDLISLDYSHTLMAAAGGFFLTHDDFAIDGGFAGVRCERDFAWVDGEIALAHMNHALAPEIETVFVPAHPELSEVSSTRLKELARAGEDVSRYCPAAVAVRLKQRMAATAAANKDMLHV